MIMPSLRRLMLSPLFAAVVLASCAQRQAAPAPGDSHAGHDETATSGTTPASASARALSDPSLPADAESAAARLAASPRHGEWVTIPAGSGDSVRAWVVYPERSTKAPVVLVVHEIFGLTSWVRAVADQLAADGFIAIAPDFLTGKRLPMAPDAFMTTPGGIDSARVLISSLDPAQFLRRVDAAARYGTSLPAATRKWGVVGFCWGGSMTYLSAASFPTLSAAVPFYGGVDPKQVDLTGAKAAVLGLYGENDARVNMTIPSADSALRVAGVPFEKRVYPGAGHGFLRQQSGQGGANAAATRDAWPRTVEWFRKYLGA
jgi:carboxymethylenebutenolidase